MCQFCRRYHLYKCLIVYVFICYVYCVCVCACASACTFKLGYIFFERRALSALFICANVRVKIIFQYLVCSLLSPCVRLHVPFLLLVFRSLLFFSFLFFSLDNNQILFIARNITQNTAPHHTHLKSAGSFTAAIQKHWHSHTFIQNIYI